MTDIITRFAPSPTGSMHLGNARTALFNYLFTKHVGGKMLLRIEDTDKERSTQESIDSIYRDLEWLGITWDEDPVMQSERIDRHKEVVDKLLMEDKAYKCYCTAEELADMREHAKLNKLTPKYNGKWRNRTPGPEEDGKPYVVRIKAPTEGTYVIDDSIKGTISIDCSELDDMILLRSDGTPVYQLAVVVDDHDMGVNYIIRGDDHLTNSFRQKMIYDAMEWTLPKFAHLPMILGTDGQKLSKRHGSCSVEDIKNDGILSETICNYMLRLGFSEGEEIISRDEVINIFDINKVNSSPARFDSKKLENMNGIYIRNTPDNILSERVNPFLIDRGFNLDEWYYRVEELMFALKERSSNLNHLADSCLFLDNELMSTTDSSGDLTYKFTPEAIKFMEKYKLEMEGIISDFMDLEGDWMEYDPCVLKEIMEDLAESHDCKMKVVGQSIRIALTFSTMSPPLSDVIEILKYDCYERLSVVHASLV